MVVRREYEKLKLFIKIEEYFVFKRTEVKDKFFENEEGLAVALMPCKVLNRYSTTGLYTVSSFELNFN